MEEEAEEKKGYASAGAYCRMLKDAEKAFQEYQDKSDSIDKLYASLKQMSDVAGDREFQIFWANLEVLKPTIYTRAPQPVVSPRQRSGKFTLLNKELVRVASELLERCMEYDVEADDLHDTLLQVRDDLAVSARGVAWVLDNGQAIHVDRCDFLHEPARKWSEVGWVSRLAYMDREAVVARFPNADVTRIKFEEIKGDEDGKGNDYHSTGKKAKVWEIWLKSENKVVWVTHDYPEVLDEQPPLIDVKGFFPCPKPAYGTLERRSLKPVPDFVYYRDQVDEINELTARISALAESLRLKGFYASGTSEIGEAIEAAMKATDNTALMVPVSNFAALGGQALKDAIVWLPVREVAEVIAALVELRRQLIEDVYEITGISDIMRGETEASETATAQNIKAQYGAVRVRERQAEMVRVARDVIRLKAEIMAETVPAQELAIMAQMDIPTTEAVQMQIMQARQQAIAAGEQPQEPDMSKIVTIEQVDALLKDQRLRPFVLDVESDSTIAPNEEAEKASRIEFITAVGGFIQQAGPMVQMQPETAPFVAEMMKFAAASFRGGRELMGSVDEFAAQISALGQRAQQMRDQPPPPDPQVELKREEIAAKTQEGQAKLQLEAQATAAELQLKERELMMRERELGLREQEIAQGREIEMARIQDAQTARGEARTDAGLPDRQAAVEAAETQIAATAEAIAGLAQGQAQMMQALGMLAQAVQQQSAMIAAPAEIVRGADGQVVGARKVLNA